MELIRNKHVVTALIVAPMLAVLSYFLVDKLVGEQPRAAVSGGNYQLVAQSNCRYQSGRCDLHNGEFKSSLKIGGSSGSAVLQLHSNFALQKVLVGFANVATASGETDLPFEMQKTGDDGKLWSIQLPKDSSDDTRLRLAILANDIKFYADTTLLFREHKPTFEQNF